MRQRKSYTGIFDESTRYPLGSGAAVTLVTGADYGVSRRATFDGFGLRQSSTSGGNPTGYRFSLCAAQCACPSSWIWNPWRNASVKPIASDAAFTESLISRAAIVGRSAMRRANSTVLSD